MKQFFSRIWFVFKKSIRNKYIIITIAFLLIIFFIADYNILKRIAYQREIKKIEKEILYYQKEIETSKRQLQELESDKEGLEKFAREKYLMKKDNEDIFIFKE